MFALAQSDARIAAIGSGLPPVLIGLDYDLFGVPSFAVVATSGWSATGQIIAGCEALGQGAEWVKTVRLLSTGL